jgi:hypothetical protein
MEIAVDFRIVFTNSKVEKAGVSVDNDLVSEPVNTGECHRLENLPRFCLKLTFYLRVIYIQNHHVHKNIGPKLHN